MELMVRWKMMRRGKQNRKKNLFFYSKFKFNLLLWLISNVIHKINHLNWFVKISNKLHFGDASHGPWYSRIRIHKICPPLLTRTLKFVYILPSRYVIIHEIMFYTITNPVCAISFHFSMTMMHSTEVGIRYSWYNATALCTF